MWCGCGTAPGAGWPRDEHRRILDGGLGRLELPMRRRFGERVRVVDGEDPGPTPIKRLPQILCRVTSKLLLGRTRPQLTDGSAGKSMDCSQLRLGADGQGSVDDQEFGDRGTRAMNSPSPLPQSPGSAEPIRRCIGAFRTDVAQIRTRAFGAACCSMNPSSAAQMGWEGHGHGSRR